MIGIRKYILLFSLLVPYFFVIAYCIDKTDPSIYHSFNSFDEETSLFTSDINSIDLEVDTVKLALKKAKSY
jgi:hypothetical protein